MENKNPYTDTVTRRYQNSDYEKTKEGWVKKIKETEEAAAQQASPADTKKEYTDEELAEYARKASDEALKKAGAGRDERMRVAAKKEILRRKNEGLPEPEKTDNPFDEGMEKGLFDELSTKVFGGKEYINKGQGWEILEKSKAAVGEIRVWSGEKYQKTNTGWKYLGKASGNEAGAKKETEEKPAWDKDWPESLDKLTNRADSDVIRAEAKAAAEAKVRAKYPTDEDFLKEQVESFEKNDWLKPFGWDGMTDEDKKKYADQSIRYQIATEVRNMLGDWRHSISKTTQIANIKGAWRAMKQAERDAKAKAEYDAFMATNEGAAGEKALGEKIKETIDNWSSAEEKIESDAKSKILELLNNSPAKGLVEEGDVFVTSESFQITNKDYRGVQVNWRKNWDDEAVRDYTVDAIGFGGVKVNSPEAQAVILQAQFLTNPELQELAKSSIEEYEKTHREWYLKMKELKNQNTKYNWDEVYKKYSGR